MFYLLFVLPSSFTAQLISVPFTAGVTMQRLVRTSSLERLQTQTDMKDGTQGKGMIASIMR